MSNELTELNEKQSMSKTKPGPLTPAKSAEKRQLHSNILYDGKVLNIIKQFGQLAETSYGPTGRLKFLQTSAGGHVTVTSSCSSIIHHLMGVSHPVLRLIMMAIQGHLELYKDGGLAMAILITRMVESSLDLDVPRAVILEVNREAQNELKKYLASNTCPWKMKINTSDVKEMMSLVKTVVGTKPACQLTDDEQGLLCTVLLEAFLQSIPTITKDKECPKISSDGIQFLYCEGSPVSETKVFPGVVLQAPEIPTYSKYTPKLSHLKVALYNVSMAGDTDEWFEGVSQVVSGEMKQAEISEGVVKQVKGVAIALMQAGVGLVACQKCIHPALKEFLKEKGVYVIERLSILHIGSVQQLTGAKILSTFTSDVPHDWFGHVGKIEHLVIGSKSYLHLLPSKHPLSSWQPVSTVVLCSHDETSLNELKTVCQSAISVLHGVLSCPYVIPGGGCLDTHLAWYLRYRAHHCNPESLERIGATKAQYLTVMNNIARCLETVAKSLEHDGGDHVNDSCNHHHWIIPPGSDPNTSSVASCVCGHVSRDDFDGEWCIMGCDFELSGTSQSSFTRDAPTERSLSNAVIDLYAAKLSALCTVFETVNVLLRVKHLVSDG